MQGKPRLSKLPSNVSGSDISPTNRQWAADYPSRMIKIDILRRQHDAALDMAQRLLELIDGYRAGTPTYSILMQLNRLYGVLRVHLAHEDVELYPALTASPDPDVARTARHYVEEMGGLALDLECFARHWSCSASITSNFDEFRQAAQDLMLALAVRIERENQYLYPLADRAIEAALSDQRDAA